MTHIYDKLHLFGKHKTSITEDEQTKSSRLLLKAVWKRNRATPKKKKKKNPDFNLRILILISEF